MSNNVKVAVIGAVGLIGAAIVPVVFPNLIHRSKRVAEFQGAVVRDDANPQKRFPIKGVTVVATNGVAQSPAVTDENGYFKLTLVPKTKEGDEIDLKFDHDDYQEKNDNTMVGEAPPPYRIYLWPKVYTRFKMQEDIPQSGAPRFMPVAQIASNIVSTEFQVPNRGSVRCSHAPCSPDGKWQATVVPASLDAGPGNVFVSGQAQCVAGPCPWTSIEAQGTLLKGGTQRISVSVRNWSDTVTYKLSGEVTRLQGNAGS